MSYSGLLVLFTAGCILSIIVECCSSAASSSSDSVASPSTTSAVGVSKGTRSEDSLVLIVDGNDEPVYISSSDSEASPST